LPTKARRLNSYAHGLQHTIAFERIPPSDRVAVLKRLLARIEHPKCGYVRISRRVLENPLRGRHAGP
jgi:hypothetical protein